MRQLERAQKLAKQLAAAIDDAVAIEAESVAVAPHVWITYEAARQKVARQGVADEELVTAILTRRWARPYGMPVNGQPAPEVRVLGVIEGYVVARRKGMAPYLCHVGRWLDEHRELAEEKPVDEPPALAFADEHKNASSGPVTAAMEKVGVADAAQ